MVTARASIAGMAQAWDTTLPSGEVRLRMQMIPTSGSFTPETMGGERITLSADANGEEKVLAELDGRYWTAETCASFTGRVVGLYAAEGTVLFRDYRYRGSEQPS